MKSPSRFAVWRLAAPVALLLLQAGAASAYEISAAAKNHNSAAAPPSATMNGQRLVLYGVQTIAAHASGVVAYNTFPNFTPTIGATATSLLYSGTSVAVNNNGGIYVQTKGTSALVKSWTWTNGGTSQYAATGLSGSVSAGSSGSSSASGTGVSAQAADGSVDWTFYNGTTEPAILESIRFHYLSQNEPIQADGRVQAVFGGAKPFGEGEITLPPRGGVTYHVVPAGAVDTSSEIVAEGVASRNNDGSVQFVHTSPFPDCLCAGGQGLLSSKSWHASVIRYLRATAAPGSDLAQLIRANGDVLTGVAQEWLNDLNAQFNLGNTQVLGALGSRYGKGNYGRRARGELAALLLNRASNRVCLYDLVNFNGRQTTVAAILNQACKLIPSRSQSNQRKAYTLLHGLNNGKCQVLPGGAMGIQAFE